VSVQANPRGADLSLAVSRLQDGRLEEARAICEHVLREDGGHPDAWQLLGLIWLHDGNLGRAAEALRRSLTVNPAQPVVLTNLGVALHALRRFGEAVESYDAAVALQPDLVEALSNRANSLCALGRHSEAVDSCDRALALRPNFPEAHNNRGDVLRAQARWEEAVESFSRALALRPGFSEALNNRALALLELGRAAQALHDCDRAVQLDGRNAQAFNTRGNALRDLGRLTEALASYERALQLRPTYAPAEVNRGNLLFELGRADQALASFNRALELAPQESSAWFNRGNMLRRMGRPHEALASFEQALRIQPAFALALNGCAEVLAELGQYGAAARWLAALLAVEPRFDFAPGLLLYCQMQECDWSEYESRVAQVLRGLRDGATVAAPFWSLALTDSMSDQLRCARHFAARHRPRGLPNPASGASRRHDRIRVVYLSADFREHPVARLLAGVLERHDRERFEVVGMSLSGEDQSELGRRVAAALNPVWDVSSMTDVGAAELIGRFEADIVVDLLGYTQGMRPGILARRPAPVQVSYLGFPGTMGADFIDYIIADDFTIPPGAARGYAEQVVRMPVCFQANDDRRAAAEHYPTRAEVGLPADASVLCSFNSNFKLTPSMFERWMGLLRDAEGSVLWLTAEGAARDNLVRQAERCGVHSGRLIFAGRLPYREHLARLSLADLFLDTFPFNGGATASDALWAGVPVLTCAGEAFASRMAGSLLNALGLPELIAPSLAQYERIARELLATPSRLAAFRAALVRKRGAHPLFDAERFCRDLERAYAMMWDRSQRGEPPSACSVVGGRI